MKNKDYETLEAIVQFCSIMTCIILVWGILYKPFLEESLYIRAMILLITGVGAIGFYIPLGLKLKKYFKEIENKK